EHCPRTRLAHERRVGRGAADGSGNGLLEESALVAEAGIDRFRGDARASGNGSDGCLLPAGPPEDLTRSVNDRGAGAGRLLGTATGAVAALLLDKLCH